MQVFFRNDDVRGTLDESLVYLTDSILSAGFSVSHAVEPANVTDEVAGWLLERRKAYPAQLEIIQHGLDHSEKAVDLKGEFGGGRTFEDQLRDVTRGRELMGQWFGDSWFPAFSFPFGSYDRETLRALKHTGYKVITTGIRWTVKRQMFNTVGRLLRRKHIGRQNIVYNGVVPPGCTFLELPVVLNNTKKYLQPDGGVQKTRDEMISEWNSLPQESIRGILTHHRYNSSHDIDELVAFFQQLRSDGAQFKTIEKIYEDKMGHLQRA